MIGSLLIVAALVTSYWSVSLALADILRERTASRRGSPGCSPRCRRCWCCGSARWEFLEWLRLAAGATAIVVALITLPMYRAAQRERRGDDPAWTLGRWGSPAMLGPRAAGARADGGRLAPRHLTVEGGRRDAARAAADGPTRGRLCWASSQ